MSRKLGLLSSWLLFCLMAAPLKADELAAGRARVQQYLQGLVTLKADFEQVVSNSSFTKEKRSKGVLYIKRPGLFRWEYSEPHQLIVADGETIWLFDEELKQVSFRDQQKALRGTPAQLLTGTGPIENFFTVKGSGKDQELDWVDLVPTWPEAEFTRIILVFEGKELLSLESRDTYGQITRIHLSAQQRNLKLDDKLFKFKPPSGFDVLGESH